MAEWLDKVINILVLQSLSLVGHSQGCLVALEYACNYPSKVEKI